MKLKPSYSGQIGIIGLAGSGKSTFLSVLPRVMNDPWYVTYSGETQSLVREASSSISRGEYPPQTQLSNLDVYEFTISRKAESFLFGCSSS